MANYILFVFEGERTEKLVFSSLRKYYLNEAKSTIVIGLYGSSIYSLFQKKKKDPDLDIFSLVSEVPKNQEELSNISKADVSEIYLFFDYDGHDTQASDDKLQEMFDLFDNETEDGKLYVSYPMIESLRHLHSDVNFQDVVIESSNQYKKHVSNHCDECYKDVTRYTQENWMYILSEHCKKLNYLVMGEFNLPTEYIDQMTIFSKQKEKHIDSNCQVAVLNSFPVFIADYYGWEKLSSLIYPHPQS